MKLFESQGGNTEKELEKELRAQNKYAILVYYKISQAEICRFSNYKICFVEYLVFDIS